MAKGTKQVNRAAYIQNGGGIYDLFPSPIIATRAPLTSDKAAIGTLWVQPKNTSNVAVNMAWILTSIINNSSNWLLIESGGGSGVFSSLVVNPGPTSLSTVGNGAVTIGNTSNTGLISIVPGSGNFSLAGAAAATITIGAAAQTGTIKLGVSSAALAVDVGSGAGASVVTIGSTTALATTLMQGGASVSLATGTNNATAGVIAVAPQTSSSASPSAADTVNSRVGVSTFTGFTTASAGTQAFTITNSFVLATSGMFVNVACATSGAELTITGVQQLVGSFVVNVTNNGGSAVADNILISFWIIS